MHAKGSSGISWSAVQSIMLQLLLPFVLGHLLRPLIGSFVARHKAMVTAVDRGSILLVVYTAFGAAVLEGLWHLVSGLDLLIIATACLTQLSVVLTLTWMIGRVLGFGREDRIVLLFCGSKKSGVWRAHGRCAVPSGQRRLDYFAADAVSSNPVDRLRHYRTPVRL
jgi:sodium/bile acid cotransporter 7